MTTLTEFERDVMTALLDEKILKMEDQLAQVKGCREKVVNGVSVDLDEAVPERLLPTDQNEATVNPGAVEPNGDGGKRPAKPGKRFTPAKRLNIIKASAKKAYPSQVKTPSNFKYVYLLGTGKAKAEFYYENVKYNKTFATLEEAAEYVCEIRGLESIEKLLKE